jgi:ribonuclease D
VPKQLAEQGEAIESILATTNLGKRQPRLAPSLSAALREGFARQREARGARQ